jgi:tetratricopeptide (TPR) repeat protein
MKRLAVSIIVAIACIPTIGQTVHMHGDPTDKPPKNLPPPVMIAGVGSSHFAITTSSPQAQVWFDQGLSLLHCFWDFEALRAFREAARLDPDCAMCQWGIYRAMEFGGSADDLLKPVVTRMNELAPRASDHEQRYIRSIVESFGKKGDEASQAYQHEMEAIIYRYPDDLDAKLLLALSLENGFDEKGDPRPGELYAIEMLRDILRDHPDNPTANHYWIHAIEQSEHPEWAQESAEKLGRLAPGSGHMVHMPGHIFYRTGDVIYAKAMQSLEREDVVGGARESDQLDALLWRFTPERDETDRTAQRVEEILGVASKELAGNVASARGNYGRAKELLQEAVAMEKKLGYSEPPLYSRPSLESLGYAAIRARDWEMARNAFRQVLILRPKSGFGYYGIALSYEKEGNRSAAARAYQEFLASWQHADEDLEMVRAAREAMGRLNAASR